MAGKLKFVSGLAAEAARRVTDDAESWKEFLRTASRLYRYEFDEQLLIYAQRPDATACASFELWNEKMHRWIKPGSKGIALIHKRRDGSDRLDYVFDVSDTRPVRGAREPYLWEFREEYHAPVLEALEERFGKTEDREVSETTEKPERQDTAERIMEIVTNTVLKSYSDYLQDLQYDTEGSPLEDAEVSEWEGHFRDTMQASVQYAVLARCGFDPDDYLDGWALDAITLFSTPATLHHLGDACSRLTMEICTEIRREIRRIEQGIAGSREKDDKRNSIENTLEKPSKEEYSESVEKFSTVKRESEQKGGNENGRTGTDIPEGGGLPDTGSGDGRGGRGGDDAHREIRTAPGELPEGAPSRDVHIHAADGTAGQALEGSGQPGTGAGGQYPETAHESGRSGREVESGKSNAVGAESQQSDGPGGGDGAAGSGLQVRQEPGEKQEDEQENTGKGETAGEHPAVFASGESLSGEGASSVGRGGQLSLFPTVEEQVEKIAQAQAEERRETLMPGQRVKNLPEDLDRCLNSALAGGGNERDSLLRIIAFYQKDPDNKEAAAFLEKEFGVGGRGILVDGAKVSVWFDKNGLFFARGNSALVPGAVLVPWERAAARVRKLLERGTFAPQDKLDAAREHEFHRQAEAMWYLAQSVSDKAKGKGYLLYLMELYGGFPDSTEKIAELLHGPGARFVFCAELDTFIQALQKDPELLRYRRYRPEVIKKEIESLDISPKQFRCAKGFEPVKGSFITEDEIAQMFRRGSGISEGKLRIYAYFMQGHDAKECEAFLRDEYGTGGFASLGYNEWHDSKGIKFTRDDEYSGHDGYETVFFNWNQVQARIRRLIDNGQYLSTKEREYLPEYEKMQLARALYNFHSLDPNKPQNSGMYLWDVEKGAAKFRPILDSPQYSASLYEDMVKAFAPLVPEEVRGYETMKRALEDMAAFVRGEYSLFTPRSAQALEAERERVRRQKEAEREDRRESRQLETRKTESEVSEDKPVVKKLSEMAAARNPEGELEKAARVLARKMRSKEGTKQDMDGQLSFDFSAMTAMGEDKAEAAEPEGMASVPNDGRVPSEETVSETDNGEAAVEGNSEAERLEEQETENEPEKAQKSPVILYRETLASLLRLTRRGEIYGFLRERETDYETAMAELEGKLDFYLNDIRENQPEVYRASQELPHFREWMVEDIMERTYQDYMVDNRDAVARHAKDPDAPAWISEEAEKAETAKDMAEEPEKDTASTEKITQEESGNGQEAQTEETQNIRLSPAVEEYLNVKAQHPDKLVMVQVGNLYLMYGKDAETASRTLHTKLLRQEIDGLGETYVTGVTSWQDPLKKLLEHGNSVLVVGQEPGKGENAPYSVIKERSASDYIPLGARITVDGRRMEVYRVDFERGAAGLVDLNPMDQDTAFREETLSFVRECIEREADRDAVTEAAAETVAQAAEAAETLVPSDTMQVYDIGLPFEVAVQKLVTPEERERERKDRERRNYRITDDNLGAWGQKTRYQNNVAAIRTLKQIEGEKRNATVEEQEILSKYTGWGGISQAFDPANEKWVKEYAELKELLTPEEYEAARSTVLNAFYTSPLVVKSIYSAIGRMGVVPGNILEPSCGAGNFLGLLPGEFQNSRMYGVELDGLTGRIAAQLYQRADITVGGFETTDYPDDFFDLALGNVPFGDYKVHDRRYDRLNLNIHDYFLVKALDKVRPGGVMAFVTTKGTMDKADRKAREALAQKADLLGAIRLPNNAFKANSGTDVTSDILFFQKRGSAPEKMPDWVEVGQTEDGIPLNRYFLQHPEMVLGRMSYWDNMYGNRTETACLPIEGADLAQQLSEAVTRIGQPDRTLLEMDAPEAPEGGSAGKAEKESIAADPDVRNFSFTIKKGKLYYRENSRMAPVEAGKTQTERIRGMIGIRDSARRLIEIQTAGASDSEVREEQARLNALYDRFTARYGMLNSGGNRLAFRQDSSYPLLCSLEVLDEEGKFQGKADMFTKRTIRHRQPVTHVDTAVEALGVSIGERACVDLGYMASLMGGPEKIPQIVEDLKGVIFRDPAVGPFHPEGEGISWSVGWHTADDYLSGNVREKLEKARAAAEEFPEFAVNVEALEAVQPKDLTAPEISVRIGAPWVDKKYYREFLFELLKTPPRLQVREIDVLYSDVAGSWNVKGKQQDSPANARAYGAYGTKRVNAYEIFEQSLNQRNVEVYDTVEIDGVEKRVLNAKETAIAQQKQEAMKEAFREWIFKDPDRRADLCAIYNRIFNAIRPREYDGQHIQFVGMNPEIRLEEHQRNAVARALYGGNTLLAHVVGAGKTYECIAAAMEAKRLGLCRKSMMVVPNHLTEQWGSDFLTLYPGAKVLVATKKDFEPKNRRKFCARIATGDYDAVIIGHTQFEKIPISPERQREQLRNEIAEIMAGIEEAKAEKQERWTVRQMERTKKSLEAKLAKLNDKKKDDTVYFEELGVDRLFVDEAQYYKNLFTFTKMRNVAGIGQADAQKSSDMYAKCRYMDEITGGKGIVFATGTPISNTMVELYTMMRYLQYDMLREGYRDSAGKVHSLQHFDNWAATFGEQVTAVELKPEGYNF